MSLRFSEEEAKALGFIQDTKGNWFRVANVNNPVATRLEGEHTVQVSKPKCSIRRDVKRAPAVKARTKSPNKVRARPRVKSKETLEAWPQEARFCIYITCYSATHRDADNLCPKWYIDELVNRNIIPDDSSKWVEYVHKKVIKVETKEEEKTEIEVFRKSTSW